MSRWVTIVMGLAAAGFVTGRVFGGFLEGLSPDYIVEVSDYTVLGLKLGLVAGTALAACQVVGERPPASLGRTVRAVIVVGLSTVGSLGLSLALLSIDQLRLLYAHQVLDIQLSSGLAHPGRYIVYQGLHHAVIVGAMVGSLGGGIYLWRGRGGLEAEAGMSLASNGR